MKSPSPYDTVTMARLYAQQGYLRHAARVYRRLLQATPQRSDLIEELADIEQRIADQKAPSTKELGLLIREWADLAKQQKTRTTEEKDKRIQRRK